MADPDFTIAAKVAVPQFDPLATVGKLTELQKGQQAVQAGILNNRLLGQQIGGREALGRAVTGATGTDGTVNWDGALTSLARDPAGAFAAPEFAGTILDRKAKEIQLHRDNLGLGQAEWKLVGNAMLPLVQKFSTPGADGKVPQITPQDVKDSIATNIFGNGAEVNPALVTRAAALIQSLPNDPAKLMEQIKGLALMSDPTPERIAMLLGGVDKTDTGPNVAVTQTPTLGGPTTVRANIDKGLSPSEATAPTPVMVRNPDGTMSPSTVTREQFVDMAGKGPVATSAPLSASGLSAETLAHTVTIKDPVNGQERVTTLGALLQESTGGPVAAGGAPPIRTPGGVVTGPPLGTGETVSSNVQQAQALQREAANVPQRRAALSEMNALLDGIRTGPKADWERVGGALAAQYGIKNPGILKGVAGQETFNKLAAQVALAQWAALGGSGSNEQLETSAKTNPTLAFSRLGNKNVIALLQGNNDALGAQYQAWQKYAATHGPGAYGEFLAGWNRNIDPRVFQAEHMAPGAVKAMLSKMTPKERTAFERSKSIAQQGGWIGK